MPQVSPAKREKGGGGNNFHSLWGFRPPRPNLFLSPSSFRGLNEEKSKNGKIHNSPSSLLLSGREERGGERGGSLSPRGHFQIFSFFSFLFYHFFFEYSFQKIHHLKKPVRPACPHASPPLSSFPPPVHPCGGGSMRFLHFPKGGIS